MRRSSSIFALLLLAAPTFARNMLYDAGDWSSLWWLPKQTTAGGAAQPGTQLMGDVGIPHLIFVPSGTPPKGGFPLIVFLHGQGESSPSPSHAAWARASAAARMSCSNSSKLPMMTC